LETSKRIKRDGYFPRDWADTLMPVAARVPCPGHIFRRKELEAMQKPEFFAELLTAKLAQLGGDIEPAKRFASKYDVGPEVVVKCAQPHIYYDEEPFRKFMVEKGYATEAESKCMLKDALAFWLAREPELETDAAEPREGVKRVKPK